MRSFATTLVLVGWLMVWVLVSGCATCCAHKACGSTVTSFDDYSSHFSHWQSRTGMRVYVCDGSGTTEIDRINTNEPAVLVLHELPGLTPQCLALATNIAAYHYTVYLPLMFDKPDEGSSFSSAWNAVRLLFSRDWYLFHKNSTSPVVKKLRIVADEIEERQQVKGMGVAGMCLTGTFPLALLSNTNVRAVVLSQPAIPLGWTDAQKYALSLSPADVTFASNRVAREQIKVLGLRFATDTICPSNRFDTLQKIFQSNFQNGTIGLSDCRTNCCSTLHSVLCEQYDNTPGTATRDRFNWMITNFYLALKDGRP